MKQMTVSDFKTRIYEALSLVTNGENVQILYGRNRRPIAVLSAYDANNSGKRNIGTFNGIASFCEKDDGKITEEEFLGL